MKVKVYITLKNEVLDPQGQAIQGSLISLGFTEVLDTRAGKFIELDVNLKEKAAAKAQVEKMCEKLLANTVIEDYRVEISA